MLRIAARLTLALTLVAGCSGPMESASEADAGPFPTSDTSGQDAGTAVDGGGRRADAGEPPQSGPADAGTDAGLPDAGRADADAGVVRQGQLVGGPGPYPGAIAGVHYRSGAAEGHTDDAGTFRFEDGKPVTFSVAQLTFAPVVGAARLLPFSLAGSSSCAATPELQRLLVLLFSLDGDNEPANGIALPAYPAASPTRALSTLTQTELESVIGQLSPGRTPVSALTALHPVVRQVDGELWAEVAMDTFSASTALKRAQGVASDGQSWLFSGTLSLERTDFSCASQQSNGLAIPLALFLAGSDHIGDVDYWNGVLWAPIEDSRSYSAPKLVEFNPSSLSSGTVHSLPKDLHVKGVPWVAVDGPRGLLYTAEWDPTLVLNIFRLSDVSLVETLPLSPSLGRVQGAAVFEGALYASVDDAAKSVFKVNLTTGTVTPLFALNLSGAEMEGIAFQDRPGQGVMHTLDINAARDAVNFRHFERTRPSLRRELCP